MGVLTVLFIDAILDHAIAYSFKSCCVALLILFDYVLPNCFIFTPTL